MAEEPIIMLRGTQPVTLRDENQEYHNANNPVPISIQSPLESNGAMPVNIQDQASRAFDIFFTQDVGSPTTLTTDTVEDTYVISVTTGHGFVSGDDFVIIDPVTQRGFTGEVLSTAGDNAVTLDRPLTFNFPSATSIVQKRTKDLNVDGSGTPQIFTVGSPLTGVLDVTRIMIQMTTTDPSLFNLFGDLSALERGLQFRIVNGVTNNLWNAKNNAELANLMYDIQFFDASHPQGVNGLAGRMTYAGQTKHGVVLRITGGESLEIIIQDDLQGLLSFRIIACGHLVTD
jgi:hypothetical protein